MITKLSHTTVWVTDQQVAHEFYVGKLGFKVHTDMPMDNGFRWLTITPPCQPDLEIVLMLIKEGMTLNAEQVEALKKLISSGALGAGVFLVDNCRESYTELVAKGVHFKGASSFLAV